MYTGNPFNSEDPDEIHHAAFHQGLHCLLGLKQLSGTEIHHHLETSTCDPCKYTMGKTILTVSICMGKSIRIQRVKIHFVQQLFVGKSKIKVINALFNNFPMRGGGMDALRI